MWIIYLCGKMDMSEYGKMVFSRKFFLHSINISISDVLDQYEKSKSAVDCIT